MQTMLGLSQCYFSCNSIRGCKVNFSLALTYFDLIDVFRPCFDCHNKNSRKKNKILCVMSSIYAILEISF